MYAFSPKTVVFENIYGPLKTLPSLHGFDEGWLTPNSFIKVNDGVYGGGDGVYGGGDGAREDALKRPEV
jgi:hypothetical protein